MSERQHNILKSSMGVAFATLLSRLLGLVRVMFEAMVLGGGAFASAWQLAFMVPNLFRRLLGEGALGTALIPILTHTEERHGIERVRRDLSVVFAMLGVVLALIVVVISLGAYLLRPFADSDYARMALHLLPLLMPYALFICFIGVIGAILNSRQTFFLPALGALLLNVFLISGLAFGFYRQSIGELSDIGQLLEQLAMLTLLSGFIQLVLMLMLLHYRGVFPQLSRAAFRNREVLSELWRLVLPGMIGGAALQLSFVIDRLLAARLGPQAVPALTYTDRIIDLPIGIFALSLGTVLMANMSRSAAKNDLEEMGRDLLFGLRQVYFICVPMAVFVVVFREPLLKLMFLRGNFSASDLAETSYVTIFYGAGIPAFCSLKVILPAFYARKQMMRTLYASLTCIAVNIILNLILMWPMRQGGIALATVVSSMLNNTILLTMLQREGINIGKVTIVRSIGRALIASLVAATLYFAYPAIAARLSFAYVGDLFGFLTVMGLFVLGYFILMRLLGSPEVGEILRLFINKTRRRQHDSA